MTSYTHLTAIQRQELLRLHTTGESQRTIAMSLGISQPTVSRELRRGATPGGYCALTAVLRAARSVRTQLRWLDCARALVEELRGHLQDRRSVRQGLALMARADPNRSLPSAECVYQWLYAGDDDARRELRALMIRPRRRRRQKRRSDTRGQISGMLPLTCRDEEAELREVIGHWEGDLVIGAGGQSAVATLVERASRLCLVVAVASRRSADVTEAVCRALRALPAGSVRSLAWDQGKEMAEHARLSVEIGAPVYFADAHSPWQRGTNENTNGVARRWIPKGTSVDVGADELTRIQDLMNSRPMPVLSGRSPNEVFTAGCDALQS